MPGFVEQILDKVLDYEQYKEQMDQEDGISTKKKE